MEDLTAKDIEFRLKEYLDMNLPPFEVKKLKVQQRITALDIKQLYNELVLANETVKSLQGSKIVVLALSVPPNPVKFTYFQYIYCKYCDVL